MDSEVVAARGRPRHTVAALDSIARAYVDCAESKGLTSGEREAVELAEERSQR